jgi:dCTP deaminase
MLKNDRWIRERAAEGMIEPFVPTLLRAIDTEPIIGDYTPFKVLSFGTSSYGYDLAWGWRWSGCGCRPRSP